MKNFSLSLVSCAVLVAFVGCGEGITPNTYDENNKGEQNITEADKDTLTTRTLSEPLYQKLRAATVQIKTKGAEGSGWGTGFFVGTEGYIVTNNHVAVGASELRIAIKGEGFIYC